MTRGLKWFAALAIGAITVALIVWWETADQATSSSDWKSRAVLLPDGSYFCRSNGDCSPSVDGSGTASEVQTFITRDGTVCETTWANSERAVKSGVLCSAPERIAESGDCRRVSDEFVECIAVIADPREESSSSSSSSASASSSGSGAST